MILKQLQWHMVNAEISRRYNCPRTADEPEYIPWKCTSGETRVYARLYKCSFIGVELWVKNPDLNDPVLQAAIMLKLRRKAKQILNQLWPYIDTES